MNLVRNFKCLDGDGDGSYVNFSMPSSSSLENATKGWPLSRQLAVYEQFEELEAYFANESLRVADLGDECHIFYDTCMFGDAQQCLEDKVGSWRIFAGAYLPLAIILVVVALIFNTLSILLVTKVRHKFPRHFLLINLSVSDTSLSVLTVMKRTADFLPGGETKTAILLYGNMLWQALWLISAFGILLLSLDCFLATRFVFQYDKRPMQLGIRLVAVVLWLSAILFTGLLVHFELSYSSIVQYIICLLMMAILLAIVAQSVYAFTLTERIRRQQLSVSIHDDRTAKQHRKSRIKSSSTIAILLSSSFIAWLPLVIYFAVDESVHGANVMASQRILAVCLVCFHMNAVINPLVYSLRFKDVRAPLRRQLASNKYLKPIGQLMWRLDNDDDRRDTIVTSAVFDRQASDIQRRRATKNNSTSSASLKLDKSPPLAPPRSVSGNDFDRMADVSSNNVIVAAMTTIADDEEPKNNSPKNRAVSFAVVVDKTDHQQTNVEQSKALLSNDNGDEGGVNSQNI